MIDHINRTRECHIVTIEDPIEVLHRDEVAAVSQREVGFRHRSFLDRVALGTSGGPRRHPRRRDARHRDGGDGPVSAAETGHLVLSTLHTVDCVETINRVVDFFPPNQHRQARITLAGALKGTICQRLVPTTDGSGRVPALEIMVVNGRIQQTIVDPATAPTSLGDPGGRVLRDADLRPVARQLARAGCHRPACCHAGRRRTPTTCAWRCKSVASSARRIALLKPPSYSARPSMDERGPEQRRDHRSGG